MSKLAALLTWLYYPLLSLAAASVLLALSGGVGHRLGLLHYGEALATLRWSATLALPVVVVAALLVIIAIVARRSLGVVTGSLLALALACCVLIPASAFQAQARLLPPIHDITTDTLDPPVFIALRAAREAAANSPDYPGYTVARQQRQAYPDLRSAYLQLPVDQAFARALKAASKMGWKVVAVQAEEGRIEAVATTLFYGFQDDVVIRVVAHGPAQSVVDIRSASRVGRSDAGANAQRIRRFLARL